AASGHNDSLAIFTLLVALLFTIGKKPVLSTAFLALSVLFKFYSVLLLPIVLKAAVQHDSGARAPVPFSSAGRTE
ncbi:hypothetical protein MYX77_14655, partial [Acidobacteriia bacterium AH_259_A11_L15]|nr:hypothetical protein [Acidobacteriia bacterium AH_259_A11_L15]